MDAQDYYRTQSIETASPAQLVSLLYHAAVAAVARGEGAMRANRVEDANRDLLKAQDIVTELRVTLDFDKGGDIARNLDALYDFCFTRLLDANVRKDPELLPAVQSTLAQLAESWDEMLVTQHGGVQTAVAG